MQTEPFPEQLDRVMMHGIEWHRGARIDKTRNGYTWNNHSGTLQEVKARIDTNWDVWNESIKRQNKTNQI